MTKQCKQKQVSDVHWRMSTISVSTSVCRLSLSQALPSQDRAPGHRWCERPCGHVPDTCPGQGPAGNLDSATKNLWDLK